jgi:hypothetical protein
MTTCGNPNYLEILCTMMTVSTWHIFHKPPTEGAAGNPGRRREPQRPAGMAECTALLITSSRALCHGSGTRLFVK